MTDPRKDKAWIALESIRAELHEHKDVPPGQHLVRVEPIVGDWYLLCTCGWPSQPYTTEKAARADLQFHCPMETVERGRLVNRVKLRQRLADAQ